MKKFYISCLFLMFVSTAIFPYRITNSQASSMPVDIQLKGPTSWVSYPLKTFTLEPGESITENLDEFLKKGTSPIWVYTQQRYRRRGSFGKVLLSPDMDLEILVQGYPGLSPIFDKPGSVVGGTIDWSTGKVYNRKELEKAVQIIKKNTPLRLPIISKLLQKANIK